ncbi:hypothetical protein [Natranaerobius trueperi]|uniref:Uncharacterized protein n=1 Tax=Natranaerobius trueperi TaxID=759412 RepID=A0A226BY51_9FIRM|nr:hypothetical protein [Natranaerobius trueperi]OWZ83264.1 hypothetical protein CDO51_09385 [Natranaerobius trueperi]
MGYWLNPLVGNPPRKTSPVKNGNFPLIGGKSHRAIHREIGVDRKAVRKYIKEYEANRAELSNGKDQSEELVQSIEEKPRYATNNRSKVKLTDEVLDQIKYHLQENEKKRNSGYAFGDVGGR